MKAQSTENCADDDNTWFHTGDLSSVEATLRALDGSIDLLATTTCTDLLLSLSLSFFLFDYSSSCFIGSKIRKGRGQASPGLDAACAKTRWLCHFCFSVVVATSSFEQGSTSYVSPPVQSTGPAVPHKTRPEGEGDGVPPYRYMQCHQRGDLPCPS